MANGWRSAGETDPRRLPLNAYEVHLGFVAAAVACAAAALHELARGGRSADPLCEGHGLHPPGADGGRRAPARRIVGLSGGRLLRGDLPLRLGTGLHALRRLLPPGRHRRDPRLGAGAFSARRPRTCAFRRNGALRARGFAPRRAPGMGHEGIQLRPPRGAQFPGGQRAVLGGPVSRRRAARRCGRIDALSGLQPQRRRMAAEPLWRPGESRGHRFSSPDERCRAPRVPRHSDHCRGVDLLCRRDAASRPWRASDSTSNGTWAG